MTRLYQAQLSYSRSNLIHLIFDRQQQATIFLDPPGAAAVEVPTSRTTPAATCLRL